ncbi:MAG: 2TM domain-containing protein [Bacteroidota bacterium]
MMDRESRDYEHARKKVKKKKEFYKHLTSYASVIPVLAVINIVTNPFRLWFIYPALFWGISVAIHYFSTFGIPGTPQLNEEWEEAEIEAEVERMRQKRNRYEHDYDEVVPERQEEEDELELKEFKKLRKEWDDSEFV